MLIPANNYYSVIIYYIIFPVNADRSDSFTVNRKFENFNYLMIKIFVEKNKLLI